MTESTKEGDGMVQKLVQKLMQDKLVQKLMQNKRIVLEVIGLLLLVVSIQQTKISTNRMVEAISDLNDRLKDTQTEIKDANAKDLIVAIDQKLKRFGEEKTAEQVIDQKIKGALKNATVIIDNCKGDSGRHHKPRAGCKVNIKKDGYVIVNLPHTKKVDTAGTTYGDPLIEKSMPYRSTNEGLESIEYTARCSRARSYTRRKSCIASVFVGVLAVKEFDYNETLLSVIQKQPNLFPPVSCEPEKGTCSWNGKVFSKN